MEIFTWLWDSFYFYSTNVASAVLSGNSKTTIVITPTSLAGGNYLVQCTINGATTETASNSLFVVDPSTMSVASISPAIVYHSESADVVVTGSGFLDTGEVACLFMKKNSENKWVMHGSVLKAIYNSATQITCKVDSITKSITGDLVVSFVNTKRASYTSLNSTLHRSINMSSIITGKFSDSLASLLVSFDGSISFKNKMATCEDIFPSEFKTFGTKPKCKTKGSTLVVVLDGASATFTPGNLHVQLNELEVQRADYTVYPKTTDVVNIPVPPNAQAPEIELVAPKRLGRYHHKLKTQPSTGGEQN